MWLLTTLIAAIFATLCWVYFKGKYRLGFLSLMLWGATFMILVDHILGYEGGSFLESQTDGLINNATVLGLLMLIPVIIIWFGSVLLNHQKKD
ncbi:MAG: hypothetical protein WC536_04605 [Patescibacteria group bacterium]